MGRVGGHLALQWRALARLDVAWRLDGVEWPPVGLELPMEAMSHAQVELASRRHG